MYLKSTDKRIGLERKRINQMIQSVQIEKKIPGHERWGSSEIYTDGNKFMQSKLYIDAGSCSNL